MILLIGSSGYIGSEFIIQLNNNNIPYITLSYKNVNKTNLTLLKQKHNITHIINCAAFVGIPNIEACEHQKDKCIYGNIILPKILKDFCEDNDVILCHISTACLYNGDSPSINGWNENDHPNFSFEFNNCSFYTGTKVISENIVKAYPKSYIWRIRLPFENRNNSRNYISKIINYNVLISEKNSISNKQEFVNACIESIKKEIPFGIYNITNTGSVSSIDIMNKLKKTITPNKYAKFLTIDEFYKQISSMPRSNCIIDNSKITSFNIKMSDVNESLDKCLNDWIW